MKKLKKIKFNQLLRYFLSVIVLGVMVRQIMLREWFLVFACFYTLVMFSLPTIFDKKFKIKFPLAIEITIYLFVFAGEMIGEIGEYFINVVWWDDLLHFTGGVLLLGVGLFLMMRTDKKDKNLKLPIFYRIAFAFCFTMTLLALWECFEFGCDYFTKSDMQKDTFITSISSVDLNPKKVNKAIKLKINSVEVNGEDWMNKYGGFMDIGLYDTMFDLLCGLLGASVASIFAYFHLRKVEKLELASNSKM